jgi:protein tyrosine/serine phosphatase
VRIDKRLGRACAATFVTISLAASAGAQTPVAPLQDVTVDLSSIRIANFGRINPNYYRGAQPQGGDYENLAALGVKTIINLTSDDADPREKLMVERNGMKYLQIPMTTRIPPTQAELTKFLSVVNDRASQPIYVHCVGGKHRTGVMTAVYRMTQDRWTADQAFREMKRYQFGADFLHPEFKRFVYGYQSQPQPQLVGTPPAPAVASTAKIGG